MILIIRKKVEVEITALKVFAKVRYWEDAEVNGIEDIDGQLIPCRKGDFWEPIIDIDKGRIINWVNGVQANIHYKVCDSGNYYLVDKDGLPHASIENDYVPNCLSPLDNAYGDYIILSIDENGIIDGWDTDFEDFFNDFD